MKTDVLIAGTGIAGLYTAINIHERHKVILITKGAVEDCNSSLAQGGVSVARGIYDMNIFIEDTIRAGGYANDPEAVKILSTESIENIHRIMQHGVQFHTEEGKLSYTREGGHSVRRILHCKDRTGEHIHKVLLEKCRRRKNIEIIDNCCLTDIIVKHNTCFGGRVEKNGKEFDIFSRSIVIATGGIGGLFKSSTNMKVIKGDGIDMVLKRGGRVRDLDKIQFHPTAFFEEGKRELVLISESLRGEGGILINHKGERFVDELLPRDKVVEKIHHEMKKNNISHVYLDMRHMKEKYLKDRFPWIYQECLKRGVDLTKEPIPVKPAQHYVMGGIEVDLYSQSSIKNLFAVGEASCTGVHGNNRLASNSILESLVFSNRAAEEINRKNNESDRRKYEYVCEDTIGEGKSLLSKICSLRGDLKDELCSGEGINNKCY